MITCPECGQQADDDAKFCDRCGQGFSQNATHPAPPSIAPLAPGAELKGGFKIAEVLSQTSHENRYRAERTRDGAIFQLREQISPQAGADEDETPAQAQPIDAEPANAVEADPAGPTAKTAELRLKPAPHSVNAGVPSASSSVPPPIEPENADAGAPENSPAASAAESVNSSTPPLADKGDAQKTPETPDENGAVVLTEAAAEPEHSSHEDAETNHAEASIVGEEAAAIEPAADGAASEAPPEPVEHDDLGEVFGRVRALSLTLNYPAFQRSIGGFRNNGRVYLVYPDEELTPLSLRPGGLGMSEGDALNVAIQVCQAVGFAHRRGLRVNDICPESVAYGKDGRIKLTGLDYISNDNELQAEPIFNDGYTAPEIYRAKKADKRADIFSIGALLYTCLTGERLDSETWREEAGPIRFYPPHVVTPALEQAVRRALMFSPDARWTSVDAFKAELLKLAGIVQIRSGALTDVGMVREHNEDSVMAVEYRRDSLIEPAQSFLYVVADGMGGAEAGEVASAIAVGEIRNYVGSRIDDAGDLRGLLQESLEQANTRILEYQKAHAEARSMGSTAVGALVRPPDAAVAWVGDSRAYLCDNGGLRQITKDHSLVQRLLEIGQITAEEARHHEHKNVITRSLGARPTGPAGAESVMLRLKRGDRLMLCSDGLTAHVEDGQIGEILRRHLDPFDAARELVVAANAGGGTDNVSVVVIFAG
jgi:serine/threonine protein phosphatase PrpC